MITEQEKKELLSKYSEDTSDELLTHLKRHFPVTEIKYDWMHEPEISEISENFHRSRRNTKRTPSQGTNLATASK